MAEVRYRTKLLAADYDLAATLDSGQAFRWVRRGDSWESVIGGRWVTLRQDGGCIAAGTNRSPDDWGWLRNYLRCDEALEPILNSFPDDQPMKVSVAACRGLRLLRQEPWECLASFICSASKRIVQIRQIVDHLCTRHGTVVGPPTARVRQDFPSADRLAACSEPELRECKMGWRARYVRDSAAMVAAGEVDLRGLASLDCATARRELLRLPGVGRKVADCVLLFAYGFQEAFPVDVWIGRGLRELYFPRRKPTRQRLEKFAASHFGPYAGYAQQYLFHYVRTIRKTESS